MDYDSDSSLEGGRKKTEEERQRSCQSRSSSWRLLSAPGTAATRAKVPLGATSKRLLSSQVMEYYQKYSQNCNLNQYFSLPTTSNNAAEGTKCYYSIYELSPNCLPGRQSCIGQDYNLKSYIPKERRRWVRPPLIGQSSSTEASSIYVKQSMTEPQQSPRSDVQPQERSKPQRHQLQQSSTSTSTEGIVITEEKSTETSPQDSSCIESSIVDRKASSPTSSVASHKPLEWDSGADVGYMYAATSSGNGSHRLSGKFHQLSTLERMALARGCSAALRLDPEGTTEQQQSSGSIRTTVTAAVLSLTTSTSAGGNGLSKAFMSKPDANSTSLLCNVSGSESEIEITPIVKNHLPGIVTGDDIKSEEVGDKRCRKELLKEVKDASETPKSSNAFKLPYSLKYSDDLKSRSKASLPPPIAGTYKDSDNSSSVSPLKKSSSMNLLTSPTARLPLKRSQSELNLCGNDKAAPRLIFNSTSSIATVVNNRPTTCNKLIQTSMKTYAQESIGVQVSVLKEEEKPPLPKRATSLVSNSLNSILKHSKSTYKVLNPKTPSMKERSNAKQQQQNEKEDYSSSDSSHNASLTPQADDTENVTGRANSFEYFPGHIYENVPNGSTSQVSSVDTGQSTSSMPNTSSSIDEKLWGDSDSLVRDLERSVNILKSLVDANKLDKQVKKRLIHHVVKRLVNAKYADDKIERDLGENIPWNPAYARNKVYRREIIQALAKNTTDSSDDWKPLKKKSAKKPTTANEARTMKEMINNIPVEIESSNSEKFDRNTDRTVMDGRKARMSLRTDECDRRSSSHTPTNKSESSECFLPQRGYNKNEKLKDMFITSTSNSSPQDQNRVLLEAAVNSRRSPVNSSNDAGDSGDWRLPTTMSERRYEMRRCSNSDSGDSKLVSYVEMEKRNQLVWITNEISHLSNLKKLLEQPKSKPERPGKSSPRKSKQSSSKPQKSLALTHHHQLQNGDIVGDDGHLNRQWSSHCNLANCPTPLGINSVRRLKKRNSCTQTETDNSAAYSRTGSEIVSARIQSPNTKLTNVCVQTPRMTPSLGSDSSAPQLFTDCPVHRNAPPLSCTCSERVCLYCKSKNLSQQQNLYVDGNKEVHGETKLICKDSEDMKKTKNQLNATKLKCTCQVINKESCKHVEEGPKKSTTASQTCDQHHSEDYMRSSRRCKLPESSSCQCSRDCECENSKLACNFRKMQIKKPPKKNLFSTASGTSCTCECKNSEETQSARSECSHHSSKKAQPYFLASSNRESKLHNCCYVSQTKDQGKTYLGPQHSVRTNGSSTSDCKCCRVCGMVYQKDRICNCIPKSYPNSVAYELSFVNDKNFCVDDINIEVKSIDKSIRLRERMNYEASGGSCACGRSLNAAMTRCDCIYNEEKTLKFNNKKCTLQDYLASNNPGFADNCETRRQYVSEIHRLRQLRKDRRMQLLAMATTTNIFTSPRPTKVTRHIQRKISDEDMKAKRRKRYLQLTEVRAKRRQQQLEEEARCNKLMAKIFCKKLQQKVLRGQVDLSQSMSVISNL